MASFEPGGVVDEQPGGFDLGGHLGERELDGLEIRDRFAELLALLGIGGGVRPCALGEAEHLRADADAAFVEGLDGDLVAFAGLAEHVLGRDVAILEDDLAGRGGANAELVFFLADGKSDGVFFDEEGGDAFVSGRGVEGREDDEHASFAGVGDPQLLAVEDVAVGAFFGPGLQGEGVGAGGGLAERVGADEIVGQAGRKRRFCASVPQRSRAFTQRVFWTSTSTPIEGSTAEIASTARIASKNVPPEPPYSIGTSIPIRPRLKSWGMSSGAKCCSSSIWRTSGAMFSVAKSRTVERKSSSSSLS